MPHNNKGRRSHEKRHRRFVQHRGRSPCPSSPQPRGPLEDRSWSEGHPILFGTSARNKQREEEEKWRPLALSGDDNLNTCSSKDDEDHVDVEASSAQQHRTRRPTTARLATRSLDQVRFFILGGVVWVGSAVHLDRQCDRATGNEPQTTENQRGRGL